mgnify:CR=1 FL=1
MLQSTIQRAQRVVLYTADGRHSGCVLDGFRLVRKARGSVHMLKKPLAWCFELSILETAHEHGASLVEVHDLESGIVYTTPLATLWRHGIRIRRGFGEQIALPLAHWHREDPRQLVLL